MIKKYYTLLIASDSNRFNRSFKISTFSMYVLLVAIIILLFFSYLGITSKINISDKALEYYKLKEFQVNIMDLVNNYNKSDSIFIRDIRETIRNGGPKISLIAPIDGYVTQGIELKKNHNGIDIVAEMGKNIIAPADGLIIYSGENSQLGNTLIISHMYNYYSLYGHCDTLLVNDREMVKKGDTIATLGKSGDVTAPHLHFEIWYNDSIIDPRVIINKYGELDVSTK